MVQVALPFTHLARKWTVSILQLRGHARGLQAWITAALHTEVYHVLQQKHNQWKKYCNNVLQLGPLPTGTPSHWLFVSRSRLSPSTGLCWTRHHPTIADHHDTPAVTGGLHPLLVLNIVTIIIITTMFMVLSSWQSHCESSPDSFDERRMAPSGRRPKTK